MLGGDVGMWRDVVGRCCREVILGGDVGMWRDVVGRYCWELM